MSWLDVILIFMIFLSGFLAMLRGFTREILSILAWALAALSTLLVFPNYQSFARNYIEPAILADAALAIGTFIVVLIVVTLITTKISEKILDSQIGSIDRTMGFIFGGLRGLILVVIAFLFFSWLVPEENQPNWISGALSLNLLKNTGNAIVSLLPEDPTETLPRQIKEFQNPPTLEN